MLGTDESNACTKSENSVARKMQLAQRVPICMRGSYTNFELVTRGCWKQLVLAPVACTCRVVAKRNYLLRRWWRLLLLRATVV